MMEMDGFMNRLLDAAKAAGIETAEIFYQMQDSFNAGAMNGEIQSYNVSTAGGLSLRGTVDGRMGYASTEAFDDAAIEQLIEGVKESAALVEAPEQDEIFAGEAVYPTYDDGESDVLSVPAEEKLKACLEMEKAAEAVDPRVGKVRSGLTTASETIRIKNSYGLDLQHTSNVCAAYVSAIATEDGSTAAGSKMVGKTSFAKACAESIGQEAAAEALSKLHAEPVDSGRYHVVFSNEAMRGLLATFSGIFSAENAQQSLSLLAGKEGTVIASDVVTLMDDPLLPDSFSSCPFDCEGSATRTKAVIEAGTLTTLLHSRKTAKKAGTQTTGNASRSGYASGVHVAPTNFFFKAGEKTLDELLAEMGDGLLVMDMSGHHAGANQASGDFSLLSNGFLIKDGRRVRPVERVTVAGNFYDLLKQLRAFGNDLEFGLNGMGSPSADAGELQVSGK